MDDILVPIFLCAVMPVSIVLIISYAKMNGENKRAQIIIKAIEANKDVDTDKLIESLKKPKKTPRELLYLRLLRGCALSLIGLCLLGVALAFGLEGGHNNDDITLPAIIGGICLPFGIANLIVYFATRKQVESENR